MTMDYNRIGLFEGYKGYGVSQWFWETLVVPAVLNKWNNKCSKCKAKKNLDIHHLDYINQNLKTLIPLCRSCHKKEHKK